MTVVCARYALLLTEIVRPNIFMHVYVGDTHVDFVDAL